jgi:hypothetical protein
MDGRCESKFCELMRDFQLQEGAYQAEAVNEALNNCTYNVLK